MSKFREYIGLVPEGIKNFSKILEGIKNQVKMELGTISEEDLNVIVKRRSICLDCPFDSVNATQAGWYSSDRTDEHCTMCKCPIKTKTASLDSNCGIEAYNLEHPNSPLPLKWEKVQK